MFFLLGYGRRRRCSISKRNITCASASFTTQGPQNNLTTPSTRMLRTNSTRCKILRLKFQQRRHAPPSALLKLCTHNRAVQNPDSHNVHTETKSEGIRPANSTQKDLSLTSFEAVSIFLLVRQQLQRTDQICAQALRYRMRFEDLGLLNTVPCLYDQKPVRLLPIIIFLHRSRNSHNLRAFFLPETHQT